MGWDYEAEPSFATIWIFARLRPNTSNNVNYIGFATIWIFARLRHRSTFLVLQYSDWQVNIIRK